MLTNGMKRGRGAGASPSVFPQDSFTPVDAFAPTNDAWGEETPWTGPEGKYGCFRDILRQALEILTNKKERNSQLSKAVSDCKDAIAEKNSDKLRVSIATIIRVSTEIVVANDLASNNLEDLDKLITDINEVTEGNPAVQENLKNLGGWNETPVDDWGYNDCGTGESLVTKCINALKMYLAQNNIASKIENQSRFNKIWDIFKTSPAGEPYAICNTAELFKYYKAQEK